MLTPQAPILYVESRISWEQGCRTLATLLVE